MSGLCEFCDEFAGGVANAFYRTLQPAVGRRELFIRNGFVLLPSLGPLAEGHLLLIPEVHCTSFADLPPIALGGLEEVVSATKRLLSAAYGSCMFFEHGTRTADCGGCGIYHAHLHALPMPRLVDPAYLFESRARTQVSGFEEIRRLTQSSYLFCEIADQGKWFCTVDRVPSQYLRRRVGALLGSPKWDWRADPSEQTFVATLSTVRASLATG